MAVVGGHPESGMRVMVERAVDSGPPWQYDGTALTPTETFAVHAKVSEAGDVEIDCEDDLPRELRLRVKTMIRTAFKHAQDESPGAPPPRQIHRWRGGSGVVRL